MARARQYADRVNIIKMVKVNGRWPFARIVERNGRIIRDHVRVDGRDEHHPEGRYYLEWYEDGNRTIALLLLLSLHQTHRSRKR